jgi:hypothetical protein
MAAYICKKDINGSYNHTYQSCNTIGGFTIVDDFLYLLWYGIQYSMAFYFLNSV